MTPESGSETKKKSQAKHFKNLGRFQDPYPRIFMNPDTFHYLRLTDSSSSSSSRLLLPAASTTRDRSPLLPSLRGILLSERNLLTDFICKKKKLSNAEQHKSYIQFSCFISSSTGLDVFTTTNRQSYSAS